MVVTADGSGVIDASQLTYESLPAPICPSSLS